MRPAFDAMQRHLASQRDLPDGDSRLLPGKLAGRFDIRTQQWDFVQFRANVQANCKVDLCSLLLGLPLGSLILFDLGYFSFPWFDYLTQMQYWFVCRLREKTTYQLQHVFYRHEGILDALVWLGSSHGARAGHLVRLVRFYDGTQVRCYLTNVLDPTLLSMAEIAGLYARRWDIELAFLTLKEQLGLHHWWSSHPILIQQQILVVLIVAQLVQALRMHIAVQANVDPFEVSLPLLIQSLPQLLQQGENPVLWVLTHGKALGFLRPASRLHLVVPEIALSQLAFPPPDLPLTRKARYVEYHPRPHRSSKKKKKLDPPVHK
jgi:Transposase DDE domain